MKLLTLATLFIGSIAGTAQANVVESHLKNIQNQVRACTVLPYTVKHGHRVFQNLISHCPSVKLVAQGKAVIKISGITFQAVLVETEYTDGDLYDVVIRDPKSHDQFRMYNVLAYGDILLGVMAGNTQGIRQTYLPALQ